MEQKNPIASEAYQSDPVELEMYSRGKRNLYILSTPSKTFDVRQLSKRVKMDIAGSFALITSTSLVKTRRGDFVMIKLRNRSWSLGFLSSVVYNATKCNPLCELDIWIWDGPVQGQGIPSFFYLDWDLARSHFFATSIQSNDVEKMEFVNIVGGTYELVDPGTRNHMDGGLQCLSDGPSNITWYIDVPFLGGEDICIIEPKRTLFTLVSEGGMQNMFDDRLRHDCPTRTVVVTSATDMQSYARDIPKDARQLFWIPDINDVNKDVVKFYGVGEFTYNMIRRHAVTSKDLEYLLKIHNQWEDHLVQIGTDEGPRHTTRVYSGNDCCPAVDDSFVSTRVKGTPLTLHVKDSDMDPYSSYVPLSVSMHHPGFHRMNVTQEDIAILDQGFGTASGICSGRKRSRHHGSLSYIGPRASSQSQPTPTEGPRAEGYHYYKQNISHVFWPFVLHLIMILSTNLVYASFFHHPYLSKFVYKRILKEEDQKNHKMRMDLADIFIFTVNYDNTMHLDKDCLPQLNEWVLEENLLNTDCEQYRDILDKYIKEWGLGIPTTCGYQVLTSEDFVEAEVIQYFCCRGLGICFRIRNHWTHLFLAHCFSHYTSTMIVLCKGFVWVGNHPNVKIFAWGKGRPKQ